MEVGKSKGLGNENEHIFYLKAQIVFSNYHEQFSQIFNFLIGAKTLYTTYTTIGAKQVFFM